MTPTTQSSTRFDVSHVLSRSEVPPYVSRTRRPGFFELGARGSLSYYWLPALLRRQALCHR
ncbi:hypothetical protein I7I53_06418 [Histoplasma capsulatum var. duboisii H88]|uniref:Uncharacterized protein n=1 Tax=Ajellomyces capsulatus (strain H88) TaxID=544711 RepID=A0A8A1L9S3_AJEC8|nr:hypothetical protein I7I53_06418 [Histoplasma capsulatum var. duboisii H88]